MRAPPDRHTSTDAMDLVEVDESFKAFIEDEWHKVTSNFEALACYVSNLSKAASLFKSEAKGTVQELQEVVGDTQTKMQLIHVRIGTDNIASDSGSMLSWEAIRKTQEDIKDGAIKLAALDGEVSSLGLTFLKEKNDGIHFSEVVAKQREQFAAFVDKYRQNLKYTKRTFAAMESKILSMSTTNGLGGPNNPMDLDDLDLEDKRTKRSGIHDDALLGALLERID
jgi:hypothetical protein